MITMMVIDISNGRVLKCRKTQYVRHQHADKPSLISASVTLHLNVRKRSECTPPSHVADAQLVAICLLRLQRMSALTGRAAAS